MRAAIRDIGGGFKYSLEIHLRNTVGKYMIAAIAGDIIVGYDELSDHGYKPLPKRYQKSDALQVQFFWVGARRSDN